MCCKVDFIGFNDYSTFQLLWWSQNPITPYKSDSHDFLKIKMYDGKKAATVKHNSIY